MPELCSVTACQCVSHLWPLKSEIDLHLAMALSNKLMGLLAHLHHLTTRCSAFFTNPLPKSISDSCRNIASLSKWSLVKMLDIKGQIPRLYCVAFVLIYLLLQ